MNIAFDATAILGPMSKNRGIGNYALSQFRMMLSQDKNNQYFFFNIIEPFSIGDYPNLTEEYFNCGKNSDLASMDNAAVLSGLIRNFIKKHKIDVFYITSPFEDSMPVYKKEWFETAKTVATVYDIIPFLFKERYFKPYGTVPSWYAERIELLRWVDKLLVISQSVKDDLIEHLNFNEKDIEVIWGAPSDIFREIKLDERQKRNLIKKYQLTDRFIMCTGGDDERKNIGGLIEAYGKLPREITDSYGLAIVCKLQEESVKRYRSIADTFGVGDRVAFTNFVPDNDLVLLYNMSSLVAFPSRYEGFGLPVTEAWACGKPVLTANNSSLCQIAGEAATLVDADDVDDISRGLEEALNKETLEIMTERGKHRLREFQWPVVADRAIKAISSLEPDFDDDIPVKTPKLAFFTPIPPQRSGIADYSKDILNEIEKQFLIDVYVDDGVDINAGLQKNIRVMNHHSFPENKEEYDYIIYQMGNSTFHYYMFPYVKKYGGIVVLHDYDMRGIVRHIVYSIADDPFGAYIDYLKEDVPVRDIVDIWNDIKRGGMPNTDIAINGFITNYADKIIVHSKYAKEALLRKNIGRIVYQIPHYAKIEPLTDAQKAKKELGIDPEKTVFSAFGIIAETKRAVPLLKAACTYLSEDPNSVFCFVGKLEEHLIAEFNSIIAASDLDDRIIVTGYTSIEDFCKYIDASDACFNLRYPYQGESSGSLARILARGKCVVVNDIGSFSEIPDECCYKIPSVEEMTPAEEIENIYKALKNTGRDPQLRIRIGKAARKYAEDELDLTKIGQKYTDAICSTPINTVSEKLLTMVKSAVEGASDSEIHEIAKTIAYCIEDTEGSK